MKQFIFSLIQFAAVLSAAVSLSSCNEEKISPTSTEEESYTRSYEEDFSNPDCPVVGRWLLSQADYNFGGIYDWSEKDVEYLFLNEGLLSVKDERSEDWPGTGEWPGVFLKPGEHKYSLDEETHKITIDSSTYYYRLKDDELVIDTGSAWDAPVFTFKLLK